MRAFLVVELPPMSTDLANLEFTADEMRRMGYVTIERLVDHILSLETQPARGDVAAAELCRGLREPVPEQGVAYEPLLDQLLVSPGFDDRLAVGQAREPVLKWGCLKR